MNIFLAFITFVCKMVSQFASFFLYGRSYAFKHEIERLVNELKSTAQNTEDKLDILESKSDSLIQTSSMIHDSLGSLDVRVQNVAHVANTLETSVSGLSQQTIEISQEQKNIAESQLALMDGQVKMKETLKDGMEMFSDAYTNIQEGVDKLKSDTKQIEVEISVLGNNLSTKMVDLQSTTDDIGIKAGSSLEKQQKLLDGQSVALDGIQFLTRFQSEALQESR